MDVTKLKNLVSASPLTNEQLAKNCGISPATLYNVLNGADLKISTLEALASELGVSPGVFFDDYNIVDTPGVVSDLTAFMGRGHDEAERITSRKGINSKAPIRVFIELSLDDEEFSKMGLKEKAIRALNK